MRLFRYSGSKSKFYPLYKNIPKDTKRIVELYLGSGAYSINTPSIYPVLGFELSPEIVSIYDYLKNVTPRQLQDLHDLVETKKKECGGKLDIRTLGLSKGETSYIKINITGLIVGQLSSWSTYPQHTLPIQQTIECLERLSNFEVKKESCSNYEPLPGDLVFCDPPYINTIGNYSKGLESSYNPQDTVDLIARIPNPIIFTYGSNAENIFPHFKWEVLKTIKVPNVRKGGVVERQEKVSYINWPQEEDVVLDFT